ncbi:hypothetical protein B0T17DRAFT_603041 [Bombardia bombarda]|uniref:Uncharacterized protein n=1 Tax=Bombardia bombarda TaxID=252184 RepID=A0AA39TMB5_9PEZI|nr:hypothetical protein B0T17DRAFT_603041 [Bombardia bombarda]
MEQNVEFIQYLHRIELANQWRNAVDLCRRQLEGPDLRLVEASDSWEQVQNHLDQAIHENISSSDFEVLAEGLTPLLNYADSLAWLGFGIDTSIIWGFFALIVNLMRDNAREVLQEEDAIISHLLPALIYICENIDQIDKNFCHGSSEMDELESAYVGSGIAVVEFLASVVDFIRDDAALSTADSTGRPHETDWEELEERCSSAVARLGALLSQARHLATLQA